MERFFERQGGKAQKRIDNGYPWLYSENITTDNHFILHRRPAMSNPRERIQEIDEQLEQL